MKEEYKKPMLVIVYRTGSLAQLNFVELRQMQREEDFHSYKIDEKNNRFVIFKKKELVM